jgi:hypothetical protein
LIGEVEKIVLNSEDALGARVVPTSPSKPKNFEEDDIPIVEDGEEIDVADIPF